MIHFQLLPKAFPLSATENYFFRNITYKSRSAFQRFLFNSEFKKTVVSKLNNDLRTLKINKYEKILKFQKLQNSLKHCIHE